MMKNNKGMTIVEVMVAFVILLIGLAGLFKVTVFSGQQVHKANIVKEQVGNLVEGYYTQDTALISVKEQRTPTVKFVMEGYADKVKDVPGIVVDWKDFVSKKDYHLQSFTKQ